MEFNLVNFESVPHGDNVEGLKGSKRAGEAWHWERPLVTVKSHLY